MPALKARGHAGGTQKRIEVSRRGEPGCRRCCFRAVRANQGMKVGSSSWRFQRCGALEEAARSLVEAHGKIKGCQPRQALRKMVDRIVLHRTRAVPAVAFYFQTEVDIILFAGLHA